MFLRNRSCGLYKSNNLVFEISIKMVQRACKGEIGGCPEGRGDKGNSCWCGQPCSLDGFSPGRQAPHPRGIQIQGSPCAGAWGGWDCPSVWICCGSCTHQTLPTPTALRPNPPHTSHLPSCPPALLPGYSHRSSWSTRLRPPRLLRPRPLITQDAYY